ncbi:MAG: Fur family transcriptional regulator [Ancrocorticia sp.]|uniref:Fur family transcriptional regulator n=1 Tax=Ancrocorticia sp. TaxID=2593684 RepID=UPI003F8E229C
MASRNTAQRAAITALMEHTPEFVSAQELHDQLTDSGHTIGLATVYRTLTALADEGKLDVLRADSETLYRHCDSQAHHHHIVCTRCGRTVEVAAEQVERWAHEAAEESGFTVTSHTIEIWGLCAQCQAETRET